MKEKLVLACLQHASMLAYSSLAQCANEFTAPFSGVTSLYE